MLLQKSSRAAADEVLSAGRTSTSSCCRRVWLMAVALLHVWLQARGFEAVYQLLREVPRLGAEDQGDSMMQRRGGAFVNNIVEFQQRRAQWESRCVCPAVCPTVRAPLQTCVCCCQRPDVGVPASASPQEPQQQLGRLASAHCVYLLSAEKCDVHAPMLQGG